MTLPRENLIRNDSNLFRILVLLALLLVFVNIALVELFHDMVQDLGAKGEDGLSVDSLLQDSSRIRSNTAHEDNQSLMDNAELLLTKSDNQWGNPNNQAPIIRRAEDEVEKKDQPLKHGPNNSLFKNGKDENGNAYNSKEKLKAMLRNANIEITPDIEAELPTWGDVASLYGSKPIIHGLETCSTFQTTVPPSDAYIGPAGMFNTGTNILPNLLYAYCDLPKRTNPLKSDILDGGFLRHVPWGKHNPISWRNKHVAIDAEGMVQNHTLPVLITKEPYFWMGSMCRHHYEARWVKVDRCPNIVKGNSNNTFPIGLAYKEHQITKYKSMPDFWNTWYGDYLEKSDEFPMLVIRFEDLVFHTEEVITKVCECGGGQLKKFVKTYGIHLHKASAKGQATVHKGSGGLLSSIMRYGRSNERFGGMNEYDLRYTKATLRKDLMEFFAYSPP